MLRPKHFLLSLLAAAGLAAADLPWDRAWRFHVGDAPGAEATDWQDVDWRPLDLPHDWSIEGATDPSAPTKGDGGFFPTGIGWYRKTFTAPDTWRGQRVEIEFDGVYQQSEVWINGHRLGVRPGGFSRFAYDLTPHLRLGADNVIAVRVDNSAQPNSRWYAGSGIYRHVRLRVAEPVHLAPDGFTVVTTRLEPGDAELRFTAEVRNTTAQSQDVAVEIVLIDPVGRGAGVVRTTSTVAAHTTLPLDLTLPLGDYWPWSPDSPVLYRAVTRVIADGRLTDHQEHKIGIRTVRVSAERGFELNGVPLKLLGGNAHDDNGPLGVAAFDRAEERRVEQLKAAGFNAVRTAHNPPAPAFLDACDRLGLLVICEAFDGWKSKKLPQDYGRVFDEWSERDLEAMVRTHRHHPSVVMWSLWDPLESTCRHASLSIL